MSAEGSRAPLIIYGGILLIGVTTVGVVLVSHCNRDAAYQDPEWVGPDDPPPNSLPPPPDRPRPK